MTSIIDEIVPIFRRNIKDTEEPYTYADEALVEYIEDAVFKTDIKLHHRYTVDRDEHTIEEDIEDYEKIIFAMQAKLDLLYAQPDFSYRTGTISVTRKNDGKRALQNKLDELIEDILMVSATGKSSDEFDEYLKRFERVLIQNHGREYLEEIVH